MIKIDIKIKYLTNTIDCLDKLNWTEKSWSFLNDMVITNRVIIVLGEIAKLTLKLLSDMYLILVLPKSKVWILGIFFHSCSGTTSNVLSARLRYETVDEPSKAASLRDLELIQKNKNKNWGLFKKVYWILFYRFYLLSSDIL